MSEEEKDLINLKISISPEKYIKELLKENQELKEKQNYDLKWALKYDELYKENQELNKQQKEFINYINSYIELLKDKPDLVEEGQKDILEEILSKYKEIIGVSDENTKD